MENATKTRFCIKPNWIYSFKELRMLEQDILCQIASSINRNVCSWKSTKTLAEEMQQPLRSVQRGMSNLVRNGFIVIRRASRRRYIYLTGKTRFEHVRYSSTFQEHEEIERTRFGARSIQAYMNPNAVVSAPKENNAASFEMAQTVPEAKEIPSELVIVNQETENTSPIQVENIEQSHQAKKPSNSKSKDKPKFTYRHWRFRAKTADERPNPYDMYCSDDRKSAINGLARGARKFIGAFALDEHMCDGFTPKFALPIPTTVDAVIYASYIALSRNGVRGRQMLYIGEAEEFLDYYEKRGWRDSNGRPIWNWLILLKNWLGYKFNGKTDYDERASKCATIESIRKMNERFDKEEAEMDASAA